MSTSQFTHVLMTRFNLATPGRELAIRTQPGWLEGRFDLFERYCLPSVAAQSNPNFRWIIYFDEDTPQEFKDRIEDCRKIVDFHPYYTGLFKGEGWARSIAEVFAPSTPLLLTTRLDNDDALASGFVERLHQNIAENGNTMGAYNFSQGLIRHGRNLYQHHHASNPFFSWLETAQNFRTACSIHHMTIDETGPVCQIAGSPAWMQIIHETNVSNKVRGNRVGPEAAAEFVGEASKGIDSAGSFSLLLDNMVFAPLRNLRDTLIAKVRGNRSAR